MTTSGRPGAGSPPRRIPTAPTTGIRTGTPSHQRPGPTCSQATAGPRPPPTRLPATAGAPALRPPAPRSRATPRNRPAGTLAAAIRRGRPALLAVRVAVTAGVCAAAFGIVGVQPAAAALATGALTWLLLTARH